jgi:putative tryptophan/tyrosine transport system substrate-binding protein
MIPPRSMPGRAQRRGGARALGGAALLAGLAACHGSPHGPLARPWQVAVLQPGDGAEAQQAVQGVSAGLRASGLQPDSDYVLTVYDAHGQPNALPELVHTAVQNGAHTVVTIGTPALQAALAGAPQTPVVFTDVADPARAGAEPASVWHRWLPWLVGDHRPAVTGAYTSGAIAALIDESAGMTEGNWGAVVADADPDSVAYRDALLDVAAGTRRGVELESVASGDEVGAAVAKLCSRGIGALVVLGDPVTDAGLAGLLEAARRCHVPVLGTQREHAVGAVLTRARDTKGAGREAGRLVARIANGADPKELEFVALGKTRLILNADAAEQANLGLPLSLVQRADEVKGD